MKKSFFRDLVSRVEIYTYDKFWAARPNSIRETLWQLANQLVQRIP